MNTRLCFTQLRNYVSRKVYERAR